MARSKKSDQDLRDELYRLESELGTSHMTEMSIDRVALRLEHLKERCPMSEERILRALAHSSVEGFAS